MFSFIKKLFNTQKTDTNSVKEDQQVKLESNHDHVRLAEDAKIKIKDNNFNKSCINNESYQKVELSQFSNFYSNEVSSSAPTSSVIIKDKSQRVCSRVATKKITKVVEELSVQSDDSDNVIDESRKQESEPIKMPERTFRFCHKCKTLKTIFRDSTKRKTCHICGSILLYLCTKCQEKHYVSYKGWSAHEIVCNGNGTSHKLVNVTSHQCPECSLKVFNEKTMRFHAIKTNHTAVPNKKTDLEETRHEIYTEGRKVKAANKKSVAVKAIKNRKYKKWVKRYCEICQKIVIGAMKRNLKCQTCSSLMQFQCAKCYSKYNSQSGIYQHFKTQCFPNDHKSINSKFQSTNSSTMSLIQHIQQIIFKCDMCTYQSEFKANLKRHIVWIHMHQKNSCQKCLFKTFYLHNLRRHEREKHSSE